MLLGTITSYSGQEEATLCIVKCLKEDGKLVFQMRNKVFNNNVIGLSKTAEKHLDLYTGAIHPWSERIT